MATKVIKKGRTLRQLIEQVSQSETEALIAYLCKKDENSLSKPAPAATVRKAYTSVMREFLSMPKQRSGKMPIFLKIVKDSYDNTEYCDVCFLNPAYTPPPKRLKPWGGRAPEGHYNCNANKYNQYFGFGYEKWSELIDTPIINKTNLSDVEQLAEILWEVTFHGWTAKSSEQAVKKITKSLAATVKECKQHGNKPAKAKQL